MLVNVLQKYNNLYHLSAIGLGSNMGDSLTILTQTLLTLKQTFGIELIAVSSWYKTKPIGPVQPDYINGCAVVKTQLKPLSLLEKLLAIEQKFGRVRKERWGPRSLDLDLLLYDDLILQTPRLEIPHPRFRERAFVLVPLAEIIPDWIDPVSQSSIQQLVKQVNCHDVLFLTKTLWERKG